MERNSPHDNNVDVKVNTRINVYGNVVMVGSISVAGVGFLFLFIWMHSYWQQAVTLAAILVYGLVGMFGLTIFGLVAALWIKLVIRPGIEARRAEREAQAQEMRNLLIHVQPEGAVLADPTTRSLRVVPFLLPPVVEAGKPGLNEQEVVRTYQLGLSIKDTAKQHQGTEYEVRKILQKADVIREK